MIESPAEAGLVHSAEADAETVPLFSVSVPKLIVMSVCTLGFYEIYWMFKHWRALQERENLDINPTARAILTFIFCYSLFSRIQKIAGFTGMRIYPGWLAAGYIILSFSYRTPDPYSLAALFTFVFLIPVQKAANRANEMQFPDIDRNDRYTKWNFVWMAAGLVLLALVIWSMIQPDFLSEIPIEIPAGIDI